MVLLHAGTQGRFRGSCREEREGGAPLAAIVFGYWLPKKQEGVVWVSAQLRYISFRAKQSPPWSTIPLPTQKKILMKTQLGVLI